ncbi:FixH family protein [Luteimonas sp. A534]
MTDEKKRPFWREPMMWLVIALPLASVIAGVSLLSLALRDSSDSVGDVVQRTAQIQVSDLSPDARARELGLSAIIRIDEGYVEVLPVTGEFRRDQPLRVVLRHPIAAASDVELRAEPSDNGWRAEATVGQDNDWNVELMPEGMPWRLKGRLPRNLRAAHLPVSSGEQE